MPHDPVLEPAQLSSQAAMSVWKDTKSRIAHIVTKLEAIATNPDATCNDPIKMLLALHVYADELNKAYVHMLEAYLPMLNLSLTQEGELS